MNVLCICFCFIYFKGNEFFCEIPEEYISDEFNLTGLSETLGTYYDYALDTILDREDTYGMLFYLCVSFVEAQGVS